MILARRKLGIQILLEKEQNLIALFYLQSRWSQRKKWEERKKD